MIDSIKDERIATARRLASRRVRAEQGRCLLPGAALIEQAVASSVPVEYVLRTPEAPEPGTSLGDVPVYEVRAGLLGKVLGGSKPVSWLAVARTPPESPVDAPYLGDFGFSTTPRS